MEGKALEPTLTVLDRRVLSACPPYFIDGYLNSGEPGRNIWQLGEALEMINLSDLTSILAGLARFDYVWRDDHSPA
ncbi:MAG: hypothetical protein FWD42_01745, partial [Solirubrobacterales bacterium]|nr:hypothetical protein [Solirubrobacterales bacterium]